ncbi:MAG: ABC transporter permease subunit [Bacteroidota bacterium]
MRSLLAIEWLKVKRYSTFWILILFYVVLLPLWNYGINSGVMRMGTKDINILNSAYTFNNVWENIGWWAGIFVVFISILTIIISTNEYQFRTNRQNVIDGWSRLEFYHAKWLMVLALAILTTIYVFIVGICFGFANGGEFPGNISKLFYIFVLSFNYYSFSLLLSIFFKRSGITIGMLFLYCMIIESMLKSLINWKISDNVGNYLPLQCSDELLPFTLIDMVKQMMKLSTAPPAWSYVLASFAWITLYYFIGRRKLMRSDW